MFVSKKLLGKIPTITILSTTAVGDHSIDLVPGKYEFTIMAGGGAGTCGYSVRTGTYSGEVQGGVGGTIILVASVSSDITIVAHVGGPGSGYALHDFSAAGAGWTAGSGESSYITDGTNNAFVCEGGTGASFYADRNASGVGTLGVAGATSSESNIPQISLIRIVKNSADKPIVGGTSAQFLRNTYAPAIAKDIDPVNGGIYQPGSASGSGGRVGINGIRGGVIIKRLP